ncbi:hypothetical protein Glove_166g100 [Diversispora epigaea]|uniref:Uncharacterized protein n=1 Tax=Diversispora epigaea TaxID=1348612 RepID=A0A397IQF7_9GLOM|nr:hypothetical protein Glove_166g100 [Diversispora epigaea]
MSKIFENFIKLLNDKDYYNVIIKVENKEKTYLNVAANKFELEKLSKKLELFSSKTKLPENFCNDIVTKYPSLIFDAEDFPSLQENALNPNSPTNLDTELNIAYRISDISIFLVMTFWTNKDGFSPPTFWNMCHGLVCTMVIIKAKGTDDVMDG